ncbi:MAG: hypothetical protein AAF447_16580 [Myxococcota bacterium]
MRPIRGNGRPEAGYFTSGGVRVPSVSEVLGLMGEREGLNHFFAEHGRYGFVLAEKKAEAGTRVHAAAEAMVWDDVESVPALLDPEDGDPEVGGWALKSFEAWSRWWATSFLQLEVLATELPMVHEGFTVGFMELPYGGTPDLVGRLGMYGLVVVDTKTGDTITPEHFCQLAAYAELWKARTGDEVETGVVVRAGQDGRLAVSVLPDPTWRRAKAGWRAARAYHAVHSELAPQAEGLCA